MKRAILFLICISFFELMFAQPQPGDLYREYAWYNEAGDCQGALRVGGAMGYRTRTDLVDVYQGNGILVPPLDLTLEQAIRAELVVEKMLCHGGTEGLRVIINGNDPVYIGEAEHIPSPQSSYAYHVNQVVPLDLDMLKPGTGNTFEFQVDTAGHWWPQNLIYGMILRIYVEPGLLEERGRISYPYTGDKLYEVNQVLVEVPERSQVSNVDVVGYYTDVDLEGDGLYTQWHYAYHKCQIYNHIATQSNSLDFKWYTEWIPDQEGKMKLAAFVHRKDGLTYMTEAITDLTLERTGKSVELCRPYKRPKGWFTRNGEFSERFRVDGDLDQAVEAKLVFRSWSPGYFNGIYINDFLVFHKEGPRYAYYEHHIPVTDLHVFETGENILTTGKTPLYHGQMVHGVEIQWPGIMVLIKYDKNKTPTPHH